MDNQEYLNQISASAKAMKGGASSKKGLAGIIRSKYFIIGTIAVVGFIALAIIGSALGSGRVSFKTYLEKFKLHIDGTSGEIDAYQPLVKSSILRSSSATLNTVLSDTSSKLASYIEEKYSEKNNKYDKNLIEEAKTNQDALESELFEAKITGNLDRVFARKMAYEISVLNTEQTRLANSTKDEGLESILSQFKDSLEKLYDEFNDFSETK